MNKGLYFLTFLCGAVAGSCATWYVVKKRYEQIAQDEIDSVKEVFARREEPMDEKEPKSIKEKYPNPCQSANEAANKPNIMEYATKLQEAGYVDYTKNGKPVEPKEEPMVEKEPYVISPEEFGVLDDYDTISLTYYDDGVLADDNDDIVEDVAEKVGEDFSEHFGEYEDDSVFVRNDMKMCDYEILRDRRTYEEVSGHKPRQVEV